MSFVGQRKPGEISITNAVFSGSILLSLLLSLTGPFFRLPEFAPPQVIYSKDLVSLLLAPWTSPSTAYRVLSRLLQSVLLSRLPKNSTLPCYLLWIPIGLTRTLVGFLFSRSVGWAYPRLFSHWALYESSGGCGPSLVAYLLISGARPDLSILLPHLRGYRWEVTEPLVLSVICALVAGLDHAPWTYGTATGLSIIAITLRAAFATFNPHGTTIYPPGPDLYQGPPIRRLRTDIQAAFLLLVLVLLSSIPPAFLTSLDTLQIPLSSKDGPPLLEILVLSYPRPDNTPSSFRQPSILSQTIASYLPYVSSSTALSIFTHASPSTHPSFTDAQHQFKDAPVTFYVDQDAHPDARQGQYLHLAEAFRWIIERETTRPEWVMLVEDDFPICGEWGWQGVLRVMQQLERGHRIPSPESTKMWGGFVGTGGSGLILHRALLPILVNTLHLHALTSSPFPAFMARRPADIVIQDCLLGVDPLCPTASPSKDIAEGIWFTRRQPTLVITSRLVMDHIGGGASTAAGRIYDSNKWRCGWRHPFHGRPEVVVVPV